MIKIGDYVSRKSYNNDVIFEVIGIDKDICKLRGVDFRLLADAPLKDLVLCERGKCDNFCPIIDNSLERDEFFYMPGKILHIDGDKSYLDRCMDFYKKNNVKAIGKSIKESDMSSMIYKYLTEYNPDILVITGHDAFLKKGLYKNSQNFCKTVIEARKYEKSSDKLVIIAGACQSDYTSLLKSGSTYASSPKKINIHALDPAIIATSISLLDRNKFCDLKTLLSKTKYGKDGIGGLICKGTMYTGYPRSESWTYLK